MKKAIFSMFIIAILVMSASVVLAKGPANNPNVEQIGTTIHGHFYTPSGTRQVWKAYPWQPGMHAQCLLKSKFSAEALKSHLDDGWYTSTADSDYICKWTYM